MKALKYLWPILAVGIFVVVLGPTAHDYFDRLQANQTATRLKEGTGDGSPPAIRPGWITSKTVAPENGAVMAITDDHQYQEIDTAQNVVIQLCNGDSQAGMEQCILRREDLKVFARAYAGLNIRFVQIDLAHGNDEYAEQRRQGEEMEAAAAAADEAKAAAKGPEEVQKSRQARAHGYYQTCLRKSPEAADYVLKTSESDDLTGGVICSAQELRGFILKFSNIDARGRPAFASAAIHETALLASRLDEQVKPSMATVWLRSNGKHIGVGSGFVAGIDALGRCEIFTAFHVTDDAHSIVDVTLANGKTYEANRALAGPGQELEILTIAQVEDPAENCEPLAISDDPPAVDEQVFMGTIPHPEHYDSEAPRWTRSPFDQLGTVKEINRPFIQAEGPDSPYLPGQDALVVGVQGYPADSGTPIVNTKLEVKGLTFTTQVAGNITLVVPARFLKEALKSLHEQEK